MNATHATHETHGMNRRRTVDVLGFTLTHDLRASREIGGAAYVWRAADPRGLKITAQCHDASKSGWILSVSCLDRAVTAASATFAGAHSKLGDELLQAPKLERALKLGREALSGR